MEKRGLLDCCLYPIRRETFRRKATFRNGLLWLGLGAFSHLTSFFTRSFFCPFPTVGEYSFHLLSNKPLFLHLCSTSLLKH